MSNVDDEGKLSSLVLTKSEDEVSLDIVEYSVGGDAPSGGIKLYKHTFPWRPSGAPESVIYSITFLSKKDSNYADLLEICNDEIIPLKYNTGAPYSLIGVTRDGTNTIVAYLSNNVTTYTIPLTITYLEQITEEW